MHSINYEFNKNIGLDFFDITVSKNNEITIPYITMNNRAKVHRAVMMDMLAKHDILKNECITWRNLCIHYKFQYWSQEILHMDQAEKFISQDILPRQYATAFMQLVTESSPDIEKTAMPLFFNKPFLVAGPVNFHKKLEELGFKLYDELFDYSFDSEPDMHTRYELIAKTMLPYINKDPAELTHIYNSIFEKCVYNKKLAMRLATDSSKRPNLIWEELILHQYNNNTPSRPADINNFMLTNENAYRF